MMEREFGGYLPLELNQGNELFDRYNDVHIARFNSGRASIVAAAKSVNTKKLYIPYYNCDVVQKALDLYCIPYEKYFIDEKLVPKIDPVGSDEWILYVNYFGTSNEEKPIQIARKYKNVIFDNTQAFFMKPVLDGNCMNVYSPRKFIGLVDGGYLVWSGERKVDESYPMDISWERAGFLFKSIELGTNAAYKDNLDSKICLSEGIKKMSVLTQKMLKSVEYDDIAEKRHRNYQVLINKFKNINELRLPMEGYAPFVYPLVVNDPSLRNKVVSHKIYTPQWWKYLLDEVPADSIEAYLSKWLLPLPVDQRYTEDDMNEMADMILNLI